MTPLGSIIVAALHPRISRKSGVTIRAPIRARLGLKPRDRLRFEIVDDMVVLRPAGLSVRDTFQRLRGRRRSPTAPAP